jgi:PAS domain S-box-containing protein
MKSQQKQARAELPVELAGENAIWSDILDQMPIGVVVTEVPGGRFVWRNNEAERLLGGGASPPIAGPGGYARYGAVHEDGRPYKPEEYPLSRAVRDDEVVEREPLYYRASDGRLMVLEVSASRVRPIGMRQLGVCTFQDVTAEHEAQRALEVASERVQLALDAGAIIGTWVWDVAADRMTADELFARTFGMDPERCRAGFPASEPMTRVHPADRPEVEAAVAEVLQHGGPYRCQYRVQEPDGLYRWVEASGRVELDKRRQPVRFPGVLLDITAWKHADEARNLLMREVDHRARNVLAIVQSMVRLTDASDPARYREEVIGRIDAMARAQTSLTRSNWQGADLKDVVCEEIRAYATPANFSVEGPKVTLSAEQVQAVNMIIHELVTNALKYGALSSPVGQVEVAWRTDEGHAVALTWRERGGPAVTPPAKAGFGTRLIRRLAAQLQGAVEMDWLSAGLRATVCWEL